MAIAMDKCTARVRDARGDDVKAIIIIDLMRVTL